MEFGCFPLRPAHRAAEGDGGGGERYRWPSLPALGLVPAPLLTLPVSRRQLESPQELGYLEKMGLTQRGRRQLALENMLAYLLAPGLSFGFWWAQRLGKGSANVCHKEGDTWELAS